MIIATPRFMLTALAGALCAAGSALGADSSATPEAQAYIERYGLQYDMDAREQEAIKLYSAILAKTPHDNADLSVARDQKYGSDPRHRIDVYYAKSAVRAAAPIVLFFHGGGFVEGDTRISDEIYANVGHYFARQHFVGMVATYRLAPAVHWPAGVEDVTAAVKWAHAHGAEYGGDPNKIIVMGHSAGAVHVAGYVFGARQRDSADGVIGAILFSGVYSPGPPGKDGSDYYGAGDAKRRAQQSVFATLKQAPALPVLVADCVYDPLRMQLDALKLAQQLCERDKACPRMVQIPGHNHLTEIFHFDTADDSGALEMTQFVRRLAAVH